VLFTEATIPLADCKVITATERGRRLGEQLRLQRLSNLKGWLISPMQCLLSEAAKSSESVQLSTLKACDACADMGQ